MPEPKAEATREESAKEESAKPEPGKAGKSVGERFVILAVRRGERIAPMTLGYQAREGEIASVAIHGPEREEAYRLLAELGWSERVEPPEAAAAREART